MVLGRRASWLTGRCAEVAQTVGSMLLVQDAPSMVSKQTYLSFRLVGRAGTNCCVLETRNPPAHANVIAPDGGFQLPPIPSAALGGFNYVSVPSASDPVVRYTVERAMADLRAADKRTRQMLMIEVAAKQLAWNILQFEETQAEDQHQVQDQGQVPVQVDVQGQPPPPSSMLDDQDGP